MNDRAYARAREAYESRECPACAEASPEELEAVEVPQPTLQDVFDALQVMESTMRDDGERAVLSSIIDMLDTVMGVPNA